MTSSGKYSLDPSFPSLGRHCPECDQSIIECDCADRAAARQRAETLLMRRCTINATKPAVRRARHIEIVARRSLDFALGLAVLAVGALFGTAGAISIVYAILTY